MKSDEIEDKNKKNEYNTEYSEYSNHGQYDNHSGTTNIENFELIHLLEQNFEKIHDEFSKNQTAIIKSENGDVTDSQSEYTKDLFENNSKQSKIHPDTKSKEEIIEKNQDEDFDKKQQLINKIYNKLQKFINSRRKTIEKYNPNIHPPLTIFKGVESYNEIERYWLNKPYSFVVILHNDKMNDYIYYVVEPSLSKFEKMLLDEIQIRLKDYLLVKPVSEDSNKEAIIDESIQKIINEYSLDIDAVTFEKLSYYIKREFIGFSKIDDIINDDMIEDISCNGNNIPLFLYHRKYRDITTNIVFKTDELDPFIIRLAQKCGKHISLSEPMIDASMPDGSRVQMTLGESVTTRGSTFTIRKFNTTPITPIDLIKWGTFSSEAMSFLWLCIENNQSLIYAGGTASGKTSSLNAISFFIPEKAKIVTLEDTRELKLPHINWIPGVTRDSFTSDEQGEITMYDLLKAALRQRPEYLLVGEVRGNEALTLFQAMSTGHTTFSTMHADSIASAIHRLENPPINVPRNMIQALDIMSIQEQTQFGDKRVRRNTKIVEVTDIDPNTKKIRTNDVFQWDSKTDSIKRVSESKSLKDIKEKRGWSDEKINIELERRRKILEYMVENNINDYRDIAEIITSYQATPLKLLEILGIENNNIGTEEDDSNNVDENNQNSETSESTQDSV